MRVQVRQVWQVRLVRQVRGLGLGTRFPRMVGDEVQWWSLVLALILILILRLIFENLVLEIVGAGGSVFF